MVVNQVSYSYKSTATILRIDGNSGCGLMFYEKELLCPHISLVYKDITSHGVC